MKKIFLLVTVMILSFNMISFAEPSEWADEAIEELKSRNLLNENIFGNYQNNITRLEFIYLMVSLYELEYGEIIVDENISFSDTDDPIALKAASVGISSGLGNNIFSPDTFISREQMAVLLVNTLRLCNRELSKERVSFSDQAEISSWAEEATSICKTEELMRGTGNNMFSPKGTASREMAYVVTNKIMKQYQETETFSLEEIREMNQIYVGDVFTDYLANINYENPNKFLGHGDQSEITEVTYQLVENINDLQDFTTLSEIYITMIETLDQPTPTENKDTLGMNYKNEDYIKENFLYGCTTYALVYSNMARAKGIPSVLVEGLNIDFINRFTNDLGGGMNGHFFVEVYIKDKWYLVDSTAGRLYLDYDKSNKSLPGDNVLWGKGIDKWEFGKDENGNEIPTASQMKNTFLAANIDNFTPASYDYIDLRTGIRYEASKADTVSYISSGLSVFGDPNISEMIFEQIGDELGSYRHKTYEETQEKDPTLNAIYLVFAYSSLIDLPDHILSLYPEAYLLNKGEALYITKHGRRVGFIYDDESNINKLVKTLPRNFFINDAYRSQDLIDRAVQMDQSVFEDELFEILKGKSSYVFDSGSDSDAFWNVSKYTEYKGGMIYTYLNEYVKTHLDDVNAFIISANIDYSNLPSELKDLIESYDYEQIQDYELRMLGNLMVLFVKR